MFISNTKMAVAAVSEVKLHMKKKMNKFQYNVYFIESKQMFVCREIGQENVLGPWKLVSKDVPPELILEYLENPDARAVQVFLSKEGRESTRGRYVDISYFDTKVKKRFCKRSVFITDILNFFLQKGCQMKLWISTAECFPGNSCSHCSHSGPMPISDCYCVVTPNTDNCPCGCLLEKQSGFVVADNCKCSYCKEWFGIGSNQETRDAQLGKFTAKIEEMGGLKRACEKIAVEETGAGGGYFFQIPLILDDEEYFEEDSTFAAFDCVFSGQLKNI